MPLAGYPLHYRQWQQSGCGCSVHGVANRLPLTAVFDEI